MPEPTTVLRAAVRPRMIGLLLLLLTAAAVCARLGVWQLDRAQLRGHAAAQREEVERLAAAPEPLQDVLAPQATFTGDVLGRKVVVHGTYEPEGQLLVSGRADGERPGMLVLTPLRVTDGPDAGAVLPVVRGWLPQEDATAALDEGVGTSAPPSGDVEVVGYLQLSESAGAGASGGVTDAISSADLLNEWGGPIYTGYVVLATSDPAQDAAVVVLDPPEGDTGGLNLQNLAYAAQWWIFGAFAVGLWVRLVRDEAAGGPPRGQGPAAPVAPEPAER
ncbi:SURF1 family protein [Cellulomonas soli]|uniref:SURF1-like protein n=1 Tax=Cellulomonas soli TaxID=931535 RepID=A0A512P8X9_9CELL|nr:SURF1 family protein [Cellulomonas soli]NYI57865.1 cytochrome oxidase assembly protein ShyY1 [Cellulomonas soli]GEP67649.1 SURF1-like protein [Cellulomonas soli]